MGCPPTPVFQVAVSGVSPHPSVPSGCFCGMPPPLLLQVAVSGVCPPPPQPGFLFYPARGCRLLNCFSPLSIALIKFYQSPVGSPSSIIICFNIVGNKICPALLCRVREQVEKLLRLLSTEIHRLIETYQR